MTRNETGSLRRRFLAVLVGTALVAVCCFTPVLVILLGAVGLSALTSYLDLVLFPALTVLLALTFVSYRRWKKSCECSAETADSGSREKR
ncbi:MAG: mercury resistance system transport protein MerF [Deltaproteobacteria bacterium]|nr:mercury resistance system transport protein MerF [Deltaproteobacteria bacterium]